MLISALCDYYELLLKGGKALPQGYSYAEIDFLVGLTKDGEIAEIIDYRKSVNKTMGKKTKIEKVPRTIQLPKRPKTTSIKSYYMDHRPLYIFGLNYTGVGFSEEDDKSRAKKSHDAFVAKQLSFIDGLHSDIIDAYRNFVEKWVPGEQKENPHLLGLGKEYSAKGFAFCLAGRADILLHEDKAIKDRWEQILLEEQKLLADEPQGQCSILGEELPIARIHDSIKGIVGGQSSGNTMVNFDSSAEQSYGKTQSYNSNVSIKAMEKYTEAMNYLLANKATHSLLGDITILQWAMSADDKYERIVEQAMSVGFEEEKDTSDADATGEYIQRVIQDAMDAVVTGAQLDSIKNIDPNVEFYIAGLKPNSSRISLKFIYKKRFGELLYNIARHQVDMQMSENGKPIPLWRIKKELIIPGSKQGSLDSALASKIFDAIIQGYPYPEFLLYTVIQRIKNDSDDDKNKYVKINSVRVGIIKAYLNRYFRATQKKEVITMSLDNNNHNPAYLCGRLFAVLEKIQQCASNNTLNRTIKDSYFSSACSSPLMIFPKLTRLSVHHLSKIESSKLSKYWDGLMGEIIDNINGNFPAALSRNEQGEFIVGYYHQFYSKSENTNVNNDKIQGDEK